MAVTDADHEDVDDGWSPGPADRVWAAIGGRLIDRWMPQLGDVHQPADASSLVVRWRGPVPAEVSDLVAAHGEGIVVLDRTDVDDLGHLAARLVEHRAIERGLGAQAGRTTAVVVLEREQADRVDEVERIAADVEAAHGVRVRVEIEAG